MLTSNKEILTTVTPQQFTHSIKVEELQKGLLIHVHVCRNNEDETIETALRTYEKTIAKFMDHGYKLAPMEGSKT